MLRYSYVLMILLIVIFVFGQYTMGEMKIIINEFDSTDPAKPERNEFIELISYNGQSRVKDASLRGHKIALIAGDKRIIMVVNLWNSRIKDGFFVLGGLGVQNADMFINDSMVQSTKKLSGNQPLFNFLPNGNLNILHGIAILYSKDPKDLELIKLTRQNPSIKITPNIAFMIRRFLVDMVVYGRRADVSRCEIFETFYPDFTDTQYVLRDFDLCGDDSSKSRSLNRCTTITTGFQPSAFKVGKKTPKEENDCNASVKFILEKIIPEVTDPLDTDHVSLLDNDRLRIGENTACSSSTNKDDFWRVNGARVEQYIQTEINMQQMNDICKVMKVHGAGEDLSESGNLDMEVDQDVAALEQMTNQSFTPDWETHKYFKHSWRQTMEEHQPGLMPSWGWLKQRASWFEYLPNLEDLKSSRYRCRLCHSNWERLHMEERYRTAMSKEEGVLRKTRKKNTDEIRDHGSSETHTKILQLLKEEELQNLPAMFDRVQQSNEEQENHLLQVTMRMMRTVFVETVSNLPFLSHHAYVILQEQNGIDMGYHHYDRMSAARMVSVISETMHDELILHLVKKQNPFSIILDGSTDASQNHYLIVYFQAIENNRPVVYFYKLILLEADETASGLFRSLTDSFSSEKHSFSRYARKNMIGFASDGAAVMMGKTNGLGALLNDWTEKKLYMVHCMAHRLHLATRHALKLIPYFHTFEKQVNEIHNFYNRHGHKRKAHLRALATSLEKPLYETSYIFEVRWISSEFLALKRLNQSWELLVSDLGSISADNSFSDHARTTARGIESRLRHRNFLMILQFILDSCQILSYYSRKMQERFGSMIGMEQLRNDMIGALELLKTKPGSYMTHFLNKVECSNSVGVKCDEASFYSSSRVEWQGIELHKEKFELVEYHMWQGPAPPVLESIRKQFLTAVQDHIAKYFPSGSLKDFEVLNQKNFPKEETELLFYGHQEIINLAEKFELDPKLTQLEWTENLMGIVAAAEEFCSFQNANPISFWSHFVGKLIGRNIVYLIKVVLVIPIGSADAERGFSIMNHIRTSRRSRLSPSTLDSLIRVRLNGPNELDKFKAFKYSMEWVKHHLRTDDPQRQHKKRKIDQEIDPEDDVNKVYFPRSSLF